MFRCILTRMIYVLPTMKLRNFDSNVANFADKHMPRRCCLIIALTSQDHASRRRGREEVRLNRCKMLLSPAVEIGPSASLPKKVQGPLAHVNIIDPTAPSSSPLNTTTKWQTIRGKNRNLQRPRPKTSRAKLSMSIPRTRPSRARNGKVESKYPISHLRMRI